METRRLEKKRGKRKDSSEGSYYLPIPLQVQPLGKSDSWCQQDVMNWKSTYQTFQRQTQACSVWTAWVNRIDEGEKKRKKKKAERKSTIRGNRSTLLVQRLSISNPVPNVTCCGVFFHNSKSYTLLFYIFQSARYTIKSPSEKNKFARTPPNVLLDGYTLDSAANRLVFQHLQTAQFVFIQNSLAFFIH